MGINSNNIIKDCMTAIKKRFENLDKLNIIIAGKSGVGKSTLINSIFKDNFADTGIGKPVTKEIKKFEKANYPLAVYDTPGLELDEKQQTEVKKGIIKIIDDGFKSDDINQVIHCIWYCISVKGHRIEKKEKNFLKEISTNSKVPVLLILTQASPKEDARCMISKIDKEQLNVMKIIPVLAQEEKIEIDEGVFHTVKSYGLEDIIDTMSKLLPDNLQVTLQNIQKISVIQKKLRCIPCIYLAGAKSFIEEYISSANQLNSTQINMIAEITAIFNIKEINEEFLKEFIAKTIDPLDSDYFNKKISKWKKIPRAVKASLITISLGETYVKLMEKIYTYDLLRNNLYDTGKELASSIFEEELEKALNEKQNISSTINVFLNFFKLPKLNIIIVGKPSSGKSTLIRNLFRGKIEETGVITPVTNTIRNIKKKDFPLTIYETTGQGFSLYHETTLIPDIMELIKDGDNSQNVNASIHCIIYCINSTQQQNYSEDIQNLKELSDKIKYTNIPIIAVLTQSSLKEKIKEIKVNISNLKISVRKVIPLLAQDMEIDKDHLAKAYGLDELIDTLHDTVSPKMKNTVLSVTKGLLEMKKIYSQKCVNTAAAAAAIEGAVPIPFADAALLIPTQLTMLGAITRIYEMDVNKAILTDLASSIVGIGGATLIGKTIVSNLLKFIPGVGSVTGGIISASAAGLLTKALGETYIFIMEKIYKGEMKKEDLTTKEGKANFSKIFKEMLKKVKQNK